MLLLGYSNGLHRAYLRHTGHMPNGHESIYPDYAVDATPYHVKHKVSDRYVEMPQVVQPRLMLNEAQRAAAGVRQ